MLRSGRASGSCHKQTVSCYDTSINTRPIKVRVETPPRRWVVLSDHEQRALEELERWYVTEAQAPVRSGRATKRSSHRSNRPPGARVVLVLACVSVALVFAGVPTAGLALALAIAIGWLFWRVWAHRADDVSMSAPPLIRGRQGQNGPDSRPGESIRQYLKWLAEAE